jgi:hypothetical protein
LSDIQQKKGIRPAIKQREFDSLESAHSIRLDDELYHPRSAVETAVFLFKQRYDRLASRRWHRQFQEFTPKCAAKNIDDSFSTATV